MDTLTRQRTNRLVADDADMPQWSDVLSPIAVAVSIVVVVAVAAAWVTPRGPLTTTQALVSMVVSIGVGVAVGMLTRSRLSLVLAPAVYVVVFELARLDTAGPTVDTIQFGSVLGIAALVVGRVVHGVLVLLPMVVGARYGVWVAHARGHVQATAPGVVGKVVLGILTVGVVGLAAGIARPASTAPILGPDGEIVPGSVAELVTVEIGGVDQVLMIRGRSQDNPVLLHLSGGPGGTDIGAMRDDTTLEQAFVVATWDQRGTGKSYATSIDPLGQLTLDQAISDTIEVTEYLLERFDEDQIILTANSWGTIPSVFAVQRRPELFRAYVGTGQMVNNRLTDQMFYEDALAWAEEGGNSGLVDTIRQAGPPPYDDLTRYQVTVGYEHQWNAYPGVADLNEMPFNTFVPENTWMDRINATRAMFDVNWFVYPQLQDYDFREAVPSLEVPVYVVVGEHEARGRDMLARDWLAQLQAPSTELVEVPGAGHRPSFEDPVGFARLVERVLVETGQGGGR